MEEKMEILNEIFKVRRLEERFERGEVGMLFRSPIIIDAELIETYRRGYHGIHSQP